MFLPANLHSSIEEILKDSNNKDLKELSAQISACYREGGTLHDTKALEAYLTTRMPATYAAIHAVLQQIAFPVASLLDLGSGPGSGWWAAREVFGPIRSTCIEREAGFIALGKRLGCSDYVLGDLQAIPAYEAHDLALFGYSYGEISELDLEPIWESVKAIAIIEPGTPRGFANVLRARDQLIDLGGTVYAPCPHSKACPHPSWCHFAVRVERSFRHRQAKQATLPYEDEKYSYVIVTKESLNRGHPRLISHPRKHTGHVELELCTLDGIEKRTVSKRHKEEYKRARKLSWGESYGEK